MLLLGYRMIPVPSKDESRLSGWVKVNLSNQKAVSLPTLPIDPVNILPTTIHTVLIQQAGKSILLWNLISLVTKWLLMEAISR